MAFDQFVYALGFGKETGDPEAQLVEIDQQTISPSDCEAEHRDQYSLQSETSKFNNTEDRFKGMICAVNKKDNSARQIKGDSGGPLVKVESGKKYQVGIYHGREDSTGAPQIYSSLDDCNNLQFVRSLIFGEIRGKCEGKC